MTFRFLLVVLLFCSFAYAWIEEVDENPLSVTSKGTKAGDCKVCRPIYNSTCRGVGVPSLKISCATAKETGMEYTVGLLHEIFPHVPVNSCETIVTCPLQTSLSVKKGIEELPAWVFYFWCEETGKNAGKWYTQGTFFWPGNVEITSVACKTIISG
ncbi:unnamed protein product [Caenorhabditis brenneri]